MDGFGYEASGRKGAGLNRLGLSTSAGETVRTGLIGAGVIGALHAGVLAQLPISHFQGVADAEPGRAETLARRSGANAYASVDALIADCDALIIAAPAAAHAGLAAAAIEAGRHVLVEKPLAATPQEAEHLVSLAHRHGVVLQTGHQERFVIEALGLRALSDAPTLIETVRAVEPTGRGLDVSVALDLMIHDLDVVASFYGASPLEIEAEGGPDRVEARLGFAGGDAILVADRRAPAARRTLRATFETGAVDVDFLSGAVRNPAGLPLAHDFAARMPDPLGASLAAFLAAAAGLGPCPAPGQAGAAAVRLAAAVDAALSKSRRL